MLHDVQVSTPVLRMRSPEFELHPRRKNPSAKPESEGAQHRGHQDENTVAQIRPLGPPRQKECTSGQERKYAPNCGTLVLEGPTNPECEKE